MSQEIASLLNEMTREEIIGWICKQSFIFLHPPRRSDLLFHRWEKKSLELQHKQAAHLKKWESMSMAKRDEYAVQFNASKDMNEKLKLLEKMKPYEDQLKQMLSESKALDKEQEAVNRLFEQIERAWEEEAQ